jgi:molybdenum cofactor biosynthesis enzyme MoaA
MPNGVEVVLKDSTKGTYYHESCKECKFYPCQDAVISVRITHDGKIKRCLIRNDNLVPLLPLLRKGAMEECAISLGKVFKLMTESMYYPHMWSPEILIKQKKGGSYRV